MTSPLPGPFHTPARSTFPRNTAPLKRALEVAPLPSFDYDPPFPESSFQSPYSATLCDTLSTLELCLHSVVLTERSNQGVLLTVGGEMNAVAVPRGEGEMMTTLRCKHFQAVPCTEIPWQTHVLSRISIWMDEEAMHPKPVNTMATALFGEEVASNVIHGDVFLCVDGMVDWNEYR